MRFIFGKKTKHYGVCQLVSFIILMKKFIDKELKKLGYQIAKYPGPDQRRRLLIVNQYQINLLFDVGANYGAYSLGMRKLGYKNRIVSFEPLNSAFNQLKNESASDPLWTIQNYALGNEAGKTKIHVSITLFTPVLLSLAEQNACTTTSIMFTELMMSSKFYKYK